MAAAGLATNSLSGSCADRRHAIDAVRSAYGTTANTGLGRMVQVRCLLEICSRRTLSDEFRDHSVRRLE